jgi:hypothetical protein
MLFKEYPFVLWRVSLPPLFYSRCDPQKKTGEVEASELTKGCPHKNDLRHLQAPVKLAARRLQRYNPTPRHHKKLEYIAKQTDTSPSSLGIDKGKYLQD